MAGAAEHAGLSLADPKGDEFRAAAEKELNKSIIRSIIGGYNKEQNAIELFLNAASQYKITKHWKTAGDVYVRAAQVSEKIQGETDSIGFYEQAAKCYANFSPADALRLYERLAKLHISGGRFRTAARDWSEIAKLAEKDGDDRRAIAAWDEARKCYEAESDRAHAVEAMANSARLLTAAGEQKAAAALYEKAAAIALETDLGKWKAPDYFYRAALNQMAFECQSGELSETEASLHKFVDLYPAFEQTREFAFLKKVVEAFKADSLDDFVAAVAKFDCRNMLDARLLLKVKSVLEKGVSVVDDLTILTGDLAIPQQEGTGARKPSAGGAVAPVDAAAAALAGAGRDSTAGAGAGAGAGAAVAAKRAVTFRGALDDAALFM